MMERKQWRVEDSSMFLRIEVQRRENAAGKMEEWYVVDVILNDKIAGHGEAANTGVLAIEGLCESTAIVYALFDFGQRYQKGIPRVYVNPRPEPNSGADPGTPGGSDPDRTPRRGSVESLDSGAKFDWDTLLGKVW